MRVKVFTLNSFARTPEGGNPAGVVLEASNLSEKQMLTISRKVGFSETAFIEKSDKADFKVRFFTPTNEVDLCGHATIATYYLMWSKRQVATGRYKQETRAGILDVEVTKDGTIYMNQNLPEYFEKLNVSEIATSLNIPTTHLIQDLPVQIVSTGLKDIMVPVDSMAHLLAIKPNLEMMSEISKRYEVIGYHVFALETKFGSTAHCRNFAPLYGIREESATGTSNGTLSCYLFRYGKISSEQIEKLTFEQGYSMNRPSEIFVRLKNSTSNICEVKVGGKAVITKELKIEF